jgi:aldehyde:ferredoxin oxidoreductase
MAAAPDIPYTIEDFVRARERMWNLKAGLTAADDTLPERLLKALHTSGPAK